MLIQRNDLIPVIETLYKNYGGILDTEFNHFGIDNTANPLDDTFNDWRGIYRPYYKDLYLMVATTGPGADCIKTKEGGAAKLQHGFWKDSHVIDYHCVGTSFAHLAFCQRPSYNCVPLTIDRLDRQGNPTNTLQISNDFGINIHRASVQSNIKLIGPYSEGCQVAADHTDHEQEITWAMSTEKYKTNNKCLWSYLLVDINEFIGL